MVLEGQAGGHQHRQQRMTGDAERLRAWIWRDFAIIALGAWLIAAPFTMGYFNSSRNQAWNDLFCGGAAAALGALVLMPRLDPLRWAICALGLWLLCAPLVVWTPSPAAYTNDSMVGALLVAFSVLIPAMPGRRPAEGAGPETPPGWSYNPSGWFQRGPIIAMAFLGFFLSRYLAAYQLRHIERPWDPFFGDGTRRVLDSEVSRAWPVSDAGLGAVSYMVEALSGFMGGRDRWRSAPWVVALFGFLVVPLGIVSIVLVILQPVAVGAWCTLCLVTAAAMLIMISPALDEIVAMAQFMIAARRQGRPFWKTFWAGGVLECSQAAAEAAGEASRSVRSRIIGAIDLNNPPWNMVLAAAAGLWIMAAPDVLGATGASADNGRLVGALIVTFSVIAFGEIARPARLLNIPLGLWLALSPWLLSGGSDLSPWSDVVVGCAVAALAVRRGRIEERFGAWNRYLI